MLCFVTGTRKSDNVQVAIKQVPKAKVKRWGKLDGRVVPIEFELLHKAATSGNKGTKTLGFVRSRAEPFELVPPFRTDVYDPFYN